MKLKLGVIKHVRIQELLELTDRAIVLLAFLRPKLFDKLFLLFVYWSLFLLRPLPFLLSHLLSLILILARRPRLMHLMSLLPVGILPKICSLVRHWSYLLVTLNIVGYLVFSSLVCIIKLYKLNRCECIKIEQLNLPCNAF